MDFATFRNAMINIPAQIVRTGRKIVYRLLAWNPWQARSSACSSASADGALVGSASEAGVRTLRSAVNTQPPPGTKERRHNRPKSRTDAHRFKPSERGRRALTTRPRNNAELSLGIRLI